MFYQVCMIFVSLYYGMLFTNWGYAMVQDEEDKFSENATFTMWVKIIA